MDQRLKALEEELRRCSSAYKLYLSYILEQLTPTNTEEAIKAFEFICEVLKPAIEKRTVSMNVPLNVREFLSKNVPDILEDEYFVNINPKDLEYSI